MENFMIKGTSKLSEFENDIVAKYKTGKYTYSSLSREYNVRPQTLSNFLLSKGVAKEHDYVELGRQFSIDEHFFDVIDSKEKAYYLGLLMADGCVTNNSVVTISLAEKDVEVLEGFKTAVKSNKELYFRPRNGNVQNQYMFNICNSNIVTHLAKYGCVPRKSLILDFPQDGLIPESLIKDFLRGYWMGDGSVEVNCNKAYKRAIYPAKISTNISSSLLFCQKVAFFLKEKLDIHSTVCVKGLHKLSGSLQISGNTQAMRFLEWMYSDVTSCEDRKYRNYLKIKNLTENGKLSDYRK